MFSLILPKLEIYDCYEAVESSKAVKQTEADSRITFLSRRSVMKESYDFSQGQRGKFYHSNAKFERPIYLDSDIIPFLQTIADAKGTDIQAIANDWTRKNIALIEMAK